MNSNAEFLLHLTQQTIYLMGVSFMLGSLCTIFILLILDMVRRIRSDAATMSEDNQEPDGNGQ